MSTQDFIKRNERLLAQMKKADFTFDVVGGVHAKYIERIYDKGQDSNGGTIGQYDDTRPVYINPNKSPIKVTPNPGRKTKKFRSYKAFRSAIGRETSRVNFRLTEQMKVDHSNGIMRQGTGWVTGLKNQANIDKFEGLSKKYGESPFELSESEKQKLVTDIANKIALVY